MRMEEKRFDDLEAWEVDYLKSRMREDEEERDPLVLDCGNPDCLMPGYHYRSECHAVEDIEWMEAAQAATFPEKVTHELAHARRKWPNINNAHEAYAVILEELDEFWLEVKVRQDQRNLPAMLAELVQIAAMAQRAAEDLGLIEPDDARETTK